MLFRKYQYLRQEFLTWDTCFASLVQQIVLSVIQNTYLTLNTDFRCPDTKWTKYNDHCYKLFVETRTWNSARDFCHSQGGDLVVISDADENKQVYRWESFAGLVPWLGVIKKLLESGILFSSNRLPLASTSWVLSTLLSLCCPAAVSINWS